MNGLLRSLLWTLTLSLVVTAQASAGIIYDESVSGDASNTKPGTSLGVLALGTSTVNGNLPGGGDDDWFQFSIAAGMQLDDIIISGFTGAGGNLSFAPGGLSFVGPFDTSAIGLDVLDIAGPSTTLGPGTYMVKAGTGTNQNTYAFDFIVSSTNPVPEPTTLALLSLGIAGLCLTRRRGRYHRATKP